MSTVIEDLTIALNFKVEDRELTAAEKKAKESADKIAKAWEGTEAKVRNAGIAIAAVGAALLLTAERAAAAGAAIDDAVKRAGVGAEEYQRLSYALEQSGGTTAGLANSLKFLSKAVVDARTGAGPAAAAFAKLGVKVADLDKATSVEAKFGILADALGKVEDSATKTDLALTIFGKAGGDLIPLLDEGASGIAKLGDEAQKLGIVMSDSAIAKAAEFDDQLGKTKKQIEAVTNEIGLALLPVVSRGVKDWESWAASVAAFGVALGGLKLVQLPGQIGLAANSMATFALRTAGAAAAAGGLAYSLGVALDSALGITDALAGIGKDQSKTRGPAAFLGELTDDERARAAELRTAQENLRDAAANGVGGADDALERVNNELDAINQRGVGRRRTREKKAEEARKAGNASAAELSRLGLGASNLAQLKDAFGGAGLGADLIGPRVQSVIGTVANTFDFTRRKTKDPNAKKGKKKEVVDTTAFDALAGDDLRRLAERNGLGETAVKAALTAGATSLQEGATEGVARTAALGRLGSLAGKDFGPSKTKDPLLSAIFGNDVPDIELSALSRGAEPQVLISTINNNFNFDNKFDINGAGDPADVGNAVAVALRDTFQGALEASTKTAKVNFAR